MEHMPFCFKTAVAPSNTLSVSMNLERKRKMNLDVIAESLGRHQGNRASVAYELGIDRTTLWRWMNRYGMSAESLQN